MTVSRRRIPYARVCVKIRGDLELIDKFVLEAEDDNGKISLIDIMVDYQWKPSRCTKCFSFGHDCSRVAKSSPVHAVQKVNPTKSGHPNYPANQRGKGMEGIW